MAAVALALPRAVPAQAAQGAAGGGGGSPDAAIRSRIADVRSRVSAVTVDGRGDDWAGVPSIPDGPPDGGGREGAAARDRDIRSVALVPTEEVLLVRVATAAPPSREDRAFWLDLDVAGSARTDLQIGLSPGDRHFLRSFRPDGSPRGLSRASLPHAVDEVVEVAVPLSLLEGLVPDRGPLRGRGARSWVRVTAFTWDRATGRFVDFASAASYRIVPDPGPLDPPVDPSARGPGSPGPAGTERAAKERVPVVAMPVEGRWYVSQGAFGPVSHPGVWAWDLARVDGGMGRARPRDSCANEDFLGWGDPVRTPVAGRVLRSRGDAPDGSPCRRDEGPANEVLVEVEPGLALHLAHLRQGSVDVSAGDRLAAGAVVGRVGNSGRTSGAHLHLGLVRTRPPGGSAPLALGPVRVGLNPGPGDPWARTLDRWEPREGFFVEAVEGGGGPAG